MGLYENLIALFESGDLSGKGTAEIAAVLGLRGKEEKRALAAALSDLERAGDVVRSGGAWRRAEESGLIRGRLRGNERGFAFLIPEDPAAADRFIPHAGLKGAMHGDEVLVRPVAGRSDDEGAVVRILSRGYDRIVGTYFTERSFGFVRPDERKYFCDVYVPFSAAANARAGDKVVAKITGYHPRRGNPEGAVEEVLGRQFDPEAEERSVLRAYDIREEFPAKAEKQASGANVPVSEEKRAGRTDFRGDLVITIDGADARDLDDAVSVTRTEQGNYALAVHIADVSEYVAEGSALDKEARARGTSVYFPDLVVPMLPKALSNGICSLNEGEDRLTLSCLMEIDGRGKVVSGEVVKGVIRSAHRMTYRKVQDILDGDAAARREYPDLLPMLEDMRKLAKILIRERKSRGSVDLDIKEAEIRVTPGGGIEIGEYERTFAHRLIEAFMLAANETVAEYAAEKRIPFVYRVHEKPLPEKAAAFLSYIRELGLTARFSAENPRPADFQKVLAKIENTPLFAVVNRVMLRSMSKAKYTVENLGHFGLASDCYCHFTSPIRRYPDLVVHRALKAVIDGQRGLLESKRRDYAEAAKISSEREKLADEAERDVDDLYKMRYMENRVGEEAEGVVSGVTSFGVFVELPNTVEGLIKIDTLPRGRYEYDEARYTLKSKNLSFRLGERVRIRVVGVDMPSRRVEFFYLSKPQTL